MGSADPAMEGAKLTCRPSPPPGEKGEKGPRRPVPRRFTKPQMNNYDIQVEQSVANPLERSPTVGPDPSPGLTSPPSLTSPNGIVRQSSCLGVPTVGSSMTGSVMSSVMNMNGGDVVPGLTFKDVGGEGEGSTKAMGLYYGDFAQRAKVKHAAGSAARLVQDRHSTDTPPPDIEALLAPRPPLGLQGPPGGRLVVRSWAEAMLVMRSDARTDAT
eukprot:Hpha_TRINITY_DN9476_c0_g1::TRINITY_DN9476_c0_g1_i1::g.139256::m.139256